MFAQRRSTHGQASVSLGALALFFVLPALLLALLVALLLPAPLAHAATKTVCATGGDYSTIQAAVSAAQPGDVIEICAGTYPENVNLSLMSNAGDLTLHGTGTVVITPTTGAAIYDTSSFRGNLTLDNLHVWSADNHAINLSQAVTANLSLASVMAGNAASNGMQASVQGTTVITNSSFLDNGGNGVYLTANGPVTITASLFSGNGAVSGGSGLVIRGNPVGCGQADAVVIDGITVTDNGGLGSDVNLGTGGVSVIDSTFNRNGGGLSAVLTDVCGAQFKLDGVTANDNTNASTPTPADGIYVVARWAQIRNVTATGNTGSGVVYSKSAPQVQAGLAPAAVNVGDAPTPPDVITISNTTASENAVSGIEVDALRLVTLTNVTAYSNTANGIVLSVTSQALGAASADVTTFTAANVANALVVSNSVGVLIRNLTPPIAVAGANGASGPPISVHNSLICGNVDAGIEASGPVSVTYGSLYNFWGDLSGPYHTDRNPSGTGDAVVDADSREGSGYIGFSPWLNRFSANSDNDPLIVGGDNPFLAFLANGSTYLGEGPGNLNDPPPFTFSTTNGLFTTRWGSAASVPAGVAATGFMTGLLTPAISGPVTVTVSGPCGFARVAPFDAEAPQLVVTKRPALQTVLPNSTVTFTVDFTNTGDLALQNVIVTDTLAPSCSTSLAQLLPGGTQRLTCTQGPVVTNFTNVVTVTANPIPSTPSIATVDVPPDQVVVTATASADVNVATPALTAAKTVGTDANACAQPGPLTVPVGSSVYYCLRLTNSGNVTLTDHTVSDPLLGINLPFTYTLAPGASLPITHSLIAALGPIAVSAPITNVFAVTSTGVITELGGVVVPPVPVTVQSNANVVVRTPSTALPPGPEPTINNYLFLPSLHR